MANTKEVIDSMLNYTANKLKENGDKLAKMGTFIDQSVNNLTVSVNAPSELEMTIPEDGVYVVTALFPVRKEVQLCL